MVHKLAYFLLLVGRFLVQHEIYFFPSMFYPSAQQAPENCFSMTIERVGKNNTFASAERLSLLENAVERAQSKTEAPWGSVLVLFHLHHLLKSLYPICKCKNPLPLLCLPS